MLDTRKCYCPYCGEAIEIVVDTSIEQQEYIEDCSVCCRPIVINASVNDTGALIEVRSENE
ncbi:MAG: hypothetical protein ACI9NY_000440 [Kiritimatiellia bacterium]|jgi:hypothetical protein